MGFLTAETSMEPDSSIQVTLLKCHHRRVITSDKEDNCGRLDEVRTPSSYGTRATCNSSSQTEDNKDKGECSPCNIALQTSEDKPGLLVLQYQSRSPLPQAKPAESVGEPWPEADMQYVTIQENEVVINMEPGDNESWNSDADSCTSVSSTPSYK